MNKPTVVRSEIGVEPFKQAPTHDEIAARAFMIFLARGGDHGHDVDDWLQAEAELRAERSRGFVES